MSEEDWVPQPTALSRGPLAVLDRVVAVLVVAGFSIMSLVIVIQVLARYVANSPTVWSEELAISLFVWSTMLAIPLGLRRGEHLTLELVSKFIPAKFERWLGLAIALTTTVTLLILGWLTLGLLPAGERQLLAGIAGGLGIQAKVSWVYMAVPVGAAISAIFTVERAIAFFRGRLTVLNADADQAVIDILDSELGDVEASKTEAHGLLTETEHQDAQSKKPSDDTPKEA